MISTEKKNKFDFRHLKFTSPTSSVTSRLQIFQHNKPKLTRAQMERSPRDRDTAGQMREPDCPLSAQFHGHLLPDFQIELRPNLAYC